MCALLPAKWPKSSWVLEGADIRSARRKGPGAAGGWAATAMEEGRAGAGMPVSPPPSRGAGSGRGSAALRRPCARASGGRGRGGAVKVGGSGGDAESDEIKDCCPTGPRAPGSRGPSENGDGRASRRPHSSRESGAPAEPCCGAAPYDCARPGLCAACGEVRLCRRGTRGRRG